MALVQEPVQEPGYPALRAEPSQHQSQQQWRRKQAACAWSRSGSTEQPLMMPSLIFCSSSSIRNLAARAKSVAALQECRAEEATRSLDAGPQKSADPWYWLAALDSFHRCIKTIQTLEKRSAVLLCARVNNKRTSQLHLCVPVTG